MGCKQCTARKQLYWLGCRQYDFVNSEKLLGREAEQITSVVGYAGGRGQSPDGRVCYYYAPELTVYEQLGHAEVVQVSLNVHLHSILPLAGTSMALLLHRCSNLTMQRTDACTAAAVAPWRVVAPWSLLLALATV